MSKLGQRCLLSQQTKIPEMAQQKPRRRPTEHEKDDEKMSEEMDAE